MGRVERSIRLDYGTIFIRFAIECRTSEFNRKLLVQLNEAYENPLTDEERTALQLIRNSHKRMIEKEPW